MEHIPDPRTQALKQQAATPVPLEHGTRREAGKDIIVGGDMEDTSQDGFLHEEISGELIVMSEIDRERLKAMDDDILNKASELQQYRESHPLIVGQIEPDPLFDMMRQELQRLYTRREELRNELIQNTVENARDLEEDFLSNTEQGKLFSDHSHFFNN